MRRYRWFSLPPRPPVRRKATRAGRPQPAPQASARKGSTIVVVIALLLALTFLGIVGYTVGVQEHGNATYFSDAAKEYEFGISSDDLFDWGLRQVILGTRLEERQSALHGGHLSLMATLFGSDLAPYNGQGVNLVMDGTGNIFADQNHDGGADAFDDLDGDGTGDDLVELNRAPFARNAAGTFALNQSFFPTPDAGYTYWDNNSPFLSYVNDYHVVNSSGDVRRMVLPSFHRPQYLRSLGLGTNAEWYSAASTQRRVLRPHPEHRAVAADGTVTDTRRFVSPATLPGGGTGYPDTINTPALSPFPFFANSVTGNAISDGVWSGGLGNHLAATYDADPNKDGIYDAIYMDLDFPMQSRDKADGTTETFVPLFAFSIVDADALLNVNAHGNLSGIQRLLAASFAPGGISPFVFDGSGLGTLSDSNEGLSVSEVNPIWGLTATSGDTLQHERFYEKAFGTPPTGLSHVEVSNMEFWWLLSGRAEYDPAFAVQNLFPGRFGEVADLSSASTQPTLSVSSFPKPGLRFGGNVSPYHPTLNPNGFDVSNSNHLRRDDNLTANQGGTYNDLASFGTLTDPIQVARTVFDARVDFPVWQHPLDLHAGGQKTVANQPKSRLFFQDTLSPYRWPAYDRYDSPPGIGVLNTSYSNNVMQNFTPRLHVDEPEETILEPSRLSSDVDSVFGAAEDATLQLSQTDQDALQLAGRLQSLAPINFGDTTDIPSTEARRRRFTATSWDLKAFSKTVYASTGTPDKFRAWEADGVFPPDFGGTNPFRSELQQLLQVKTGTNVSRQLSATDLQRKLSINHLLDTDLNNRLRFRPLTPHPLGLSASPIGTHTGITRPEQIKGSNFSVQRQEWLARYDRQRLCRDIYVLLYTLGGGNDGRNYTQTNGNDPLASSDLHVFADKATGQIPATLTNRGDECRLMAQFAVNLVDQMDEDDVMTLFEYDVNLANGWNLNDNPFDETTAESNDRRVVVGVERQQLALNEAQVVFAKHVKQVGSSDPAMAVDYGGTQWDDKKNRDWTFLELENVGLDPVRFNNESWQISVKPGRPGISFDPTDPTQQVNVLVVKDADGNRLTPGQESVIGHERRLTFTANMSPVGTGANSRLMLGTAGDFDKLGDGATDPDGVFRVDPNYDPTMPPPNFVPIVPAQPYGGARVDLMAAINQGLFRVNEAPSSSPSYPQSHDGLPTPPPGSIALIGDGPDIVPAGTDRKSGHLLHLELRDPATFLPDPDAIQEVDDRELYVTFELRRRLNPNRTALTATPSANPDPQTDPHERQSYDNPWIVVDQLTVPIDVFELNQQSMQATATDVQDQLRTKVANAMRSTERHQPLNGPSAANSQFMTGNSFGNSNPQGGGGTVPATYSLYQPHFNRPFGSLAELLNVPLYGPVQLLNPTGVTTDGNNGWRPHFGANKPGRTQSDGNDNLTTVNLARQNLPVNLVGDFRVAAHKFLSPAFPNTTTSGGDTNFDNRWYRLFEFIEIPDRSHSHPALDGTDLLTRSPFVQDIGNTGFPLDWDNNSDIMRPFYRRPGRIQLNTLRHPEVLGGLLDDPEVVRLNAATPGYGAGGNTFLLDQKSLDGNTGGDANRDWWVRYIQSRDGTDPVTGGFVPGLPVAKPFRDFSFSAEGTASIEDTLLRKLPGDQRLLFELGSATERNNNSLDRTIRHRMLSKVLNNSTNRSNVFLIFMQVDFFQAAEVTDPGTGKAVVRIGNKLADSPAYRGFFVVDRSKIFETLGNISRQDNTFDPNKHFLPYYFHDPLDTTDPISGTVSDPNDESTWWKFNYSFNQDFDFHQLILHRQTIN